jgi:DNA-binding SARP family transcriptional activator
MDPSLRFALLGPLRVWRDGHELPLGPAKERAVLAVLLLSANRPVPVPRIVDAVWPEDRPADGANVVQKHVGGLRRLLEPQRPARAPGRTLALTDAGYLLRVAPGNLDTDAIRSRVRSAAAARAAGLAEEALAVLHEALVGGREPPLSGLDGSFFESARTRLTAQRADAAELWAETALGSGHHELLVDDLPDLVAEFPVRERLRAVLMRALYCRGRQAEALAVYQGAREYLVAEYGVEPGEELRDLHRRILRNDPGLASPAMPAHEPIPIPIPIPEPEPEPGWEPIPIPVPEPRPAPRPRTLPLVGGLVGALFALASVGLVTWAVIAVYAAARRSRWLGVAAAGYGAFSVTWLAVVPADGAAHYNLRMAVVVASMLLCAVGGAAHIGYLALRPPRYAVGPQHPPAA